LQPVATTFTGPISMTRVLSTSNPTYWVNQVTFPPDVGGQYLLSIEIATQNATVYVASGGAAGFIGNGTTYGQTVFSDYWPQGSVQSSAISVGTTSAAIGPSSALETVNITLTGLFNVLGSGGTLTVDLPLIPTATTAGNFAINWIITQVPPVGFGVTEETKVAAMELQLETLTKRLSRLDAFLASVQVPSAPTPSPSLGPCSHSLPDDDLKESPVSVVVPDGPTPTPNSSFSGWFGKGNGVKLPPLPARPLPAKDLTRYGIERNPGPIIAIDLFVEESYAIIFGPPNDASPWLSLLGHIPSSNFSFDVVSSILAEKFDCVVPTDLWSHHHACLVLDVMVSSLICDFDSLNETSDDEFDAVSDSDHDTAAA